MKSRKQHNCYLFIDNYIVFLSKISEHTLSNWIIHFPKFKPAFLYYQNLKQNSITNL